MPRGNTKSGHASRGRTPKEVRDRSKVKTGEASPDSGYQPVDVPLQTQQRALNIFRDSLNPTSDDKLLIQEVKGHLFDRNFAVAFGQAEYLRVYAARWSPSRALGYVQILSDIQSHLLHNNSHEDGGDLDRLKAVSIGGGAGAELVGFGTWLHSLSGSVQDIVNIDACFIDIAQWKEVLGRLYTSLITPPLLSKYASAVAREQGTAMLSGDVLNIEVVQGDVLSPESVAFEAIRGASLVTIMFTLNELYSTSVPKTQQMLSRLTSNLKPGSHLLVVDSPGSYSTITINGSEKKYPMHWLLDHTLLGAPPGTKNDIPEPTWKKLVTDESRWFRIPPKLTYPIELENMRYQIHLYRRLAPDAVAET